jgi:hypothetical protein
MVCVLNEAQRKLRARRGPWNTTRTKNEQKEATTTKRNIETGRITSRTMIRNCRRK